MKKTIALLLFFNFILYSCAIFVPPTGGPKDEEGPKLIKSIPETGTINFSKNSIQLEFNEAINIDKFQREFLISPKLKQNVSTKLKNNTLIIEFHEKLLDSTTYKLNFRNGITDITEKNPSKNLNIIFSTGPKIDSLQLEGKTIGIHSGKILKNTFVGLYEIHEHDSIPLLKKLPNYFTQVDTTGIFKLDYIKKSNYRLIAFNDKNENQYYDKENEEIGFFSDTLFFNGDEKNKKYSLLLAKEDHDKPRVSQEISRQKNYELRLNENIEKISTNDTTLKYNLIRPNTILFFKNQNLIKDTTQIEINISDSSRNDTTFETKIYFSSIGKIKEKPEILNVRSNASTINKTPFPENFQLFFEKPIININENKIKLLQDSIEIEKTFRWLDNNLNKLEIISQKAQNTKSILTLEIESNAITSIDKDTNSTIKIVQNILAKEELAQLELKFSKDTLQRIVQLLNTKGEKQYQEISKEKNIIFREIIPGEYYLKVILDKNQNNYWDQADFNKNKQAEIIYIHDKLIKLKENFEITVIVDI